MPDKICSDETEFVCLTYDSDDLLGSQTKARIAGADCFMLIQGECANVVFWVNANHCCAPLRTGLVIQAAQKPDTTVNFAAEMLLKLIRLRVKELEAGLNSIANVMGNDSDKDWKLSFCVKTAETLLGLIKTAPAQAQTESPGPTGAMMSYSEACDRIALGRPHRWSSDSAGSAEFERDLAEARRMSDPATWPENKTKGS